MSSQVFYRKWRPQTLSEVVGQQHITQTLSRAIAGGRIGHAYLFCGPRGTGKTSTGRILSKAVNCLAPVEGEPCNQCQMCMAINEGSALDIIEIDAASNRGIEDIRQLREKVVFTPNQARYKVYIIDEVHMITDAAANAFLKTLEEPPSHAIFILATTEPHKILGTIMSRCQRFDFRRLTQASVIDKLQFICGKEQIHAEPEALKLIARVTTGSLRDAENILEQLVSYYGNTIALHQVQSMLGITGDIRTRELAQYLIRKELSAGLNTINGISDDGLDLRQINRELVSYLRDLLLVKSGSEDVVDATSDDLGDMKNLASEASLDFLLAAVKHFGSLDIRLDNYSPLPLEMALIETILSEDKQEHADKVGKSEPVQLVEDKKKSMYSPKQSRSSLTEHDRDHDQGTKTSKSAPDANKAGGSARIIEDKDVDPVSEPAKSNLKSEQIPASVKADDLSDKLPAESSVIDIDYIRNNWRNFIESLRGTGSKGNLDAFMRSACEPINLDDKVLTIGFYHKFHKEYIDDAKYRFLVEQKLHDVFGKPYKLRCIIVDQPKDTKKSLQTEENPLVKTALDRGAKLL